MTKCKECGKKLTRFLNEYPYKGKFYCYRCYNEVRNKEKKMKEWKREKSLEKTYVEKQKQMIGLKYSYLKLGTITKIIKTWKPRGLTTHQQYKKSLKTYLENNLPEKILIGPEHGAGFSKIDIAIGNAKPKRDIAIEIKKNLTANELLKTKGQIDTYVRAGFKNVIVILVGNVDNSLKRELKNFCDDQYTSIKIIEK